MFPAPDGFVGSGSTEWTADSTHTSQVEAIWGPAPGTYAIILAFTLQTIAFIARAYVVMPSVIRN